MAERETMRTLLGQAPAAQCICALRLCARWSSLAVACLHHHSRTRHRDYSPSLVQARQENAELCEENVELCSEVAALCTECEQMEGLGSEVEVTRAS